jgi:hypothetical protein
LENEEVGFELLKAKLVLLIIIEHFGENTPQQGVTCKPGWCTVLKQSWYQVVSTLQRDIVYLLAVE